MPAILPSASKTVHGSIEPAACRPRRRSISLPMSSALGMKVYQSFHSSPSLTASVSPSIWSCDKGFSCAWGPLSETGSSQGIFYLSRRKHFTVIARSASDEAIQFHFAAMDCFACARNDERWHQLLIQKIQRQPGARPVHRDEFALAGQRDIGGLEIRPAERDVGVTRSPVGTCSTMAPSGAITEIQPEIRVATQ